MRWPAILFVVVTLLVITLATGRSCSDRSAGALSPIAEAPAPDPQPPGVACDLHCATPEPHGGRQR